MYNSHGIIAYKLVQNTTPLFLVSQRKDSLVLIQLLRQSHRLPKQDLEEKILLLPALEAKRLTIFSFDDIWEDLYLEKTNKIYVTEVHRARQNYNFLLENFKDLLLLQAESGIECEWGIPKGRRNYQETGFDCALREWNEETAASKSILWLVNTRPFYYKLSYGGKEVCVECWLARIDTSVEFQTKSTKIRPYVSNEVGVLKWVTLGELEQLVSPSIFATFKEVNNFVLANLI